MSDFKEMIYWFYAEYLDDNKRLVKITSPMFVNRFDAELSERTFDNRWPYLSVYRKFKFKGIKAAVLHKEFKESFEVDINDK